MREFKLENAYVDISPIPLLAGVMETIQRMVNFLQKIGGIEPTRGNFKHTLRKAIN